MKKGVWVPLSSVIDNRNTNYCSGPRIYRYDYHYDEAGNLIYVEDDSGYWEKYTYDDNENLVF